MKNKITSIFFAVLLLSISVINVITPQKIFSTKENRYLEQFPELNRDEISSGEFGKKFDEYSSDQFIFRDLWIRLKTFSDLAICKKDNARVYFGKEDYLFDVDNPIDKEQKDKNISNINKLLDDLKESQRDIDVYALLVASKSEVLKEKLPNFAPTVDEVKIIDELEGALRENINILSLIDPLKNKSNQDIYYKTDHHWTSRGAYYAYKHFIETKGKKPLSEEDFIIETVSKDFLGTSYRKANYYSGTPDSIQRYMPKNKLDYDITINQRDKTNSLYDSSFLEKTDKYAYFLGGDQSLIEMETSVKNGKSILIVKDSFANSFIPFLSNHYEQITVIDPRYFNMSIREYIKDKDIDEIVFLFSIQNFINEKTIQG